MKTKIKVQEIEDKNTNVTINDADHTISEIKKEIKDCFICGLSPCRCKPTPVVEMWEN